MSYLLRSGGKSTVLTLPGLSPFFRWLETSTVKRLEASRCFFSSGVVERQSWLFCPSIRMTLSSFFAGSVFSSPRVAGTASAGAAAGGREDGGGPRPPPGGAGGGAGSGGGGGGAAPPCVQAPGGFPARRPPPSGWLLGEFLQPLQDDRLDLDRGRLGLHLDHAT